MRVENEHTLQGRIENKEREKNSKERSTLRGKRGQSSSNNSDHNSDKGK
jgi:hypothetical protein